MDPVSYTHQMCIRDSRYKGHVKKTMWQMQKYQKMYRRGVPVEEIAKMYRDIR